MLGERRSFPGAAVSGGAMEANRVVALLFIGAIGGCRQDPPVASIPPDLSWADGAFCAGTRVAGTCVAAFFEPAVVCWRAVGKCMDQTSFARAACDYPRLRDTCWENGALLHYSHACTTFGYQWTGPRGEDCLRLDGRGRGSVLTLHRGGSSLGLDPVNGGYEAHCQRGLVPIDCPVIREMLEPWRGCSKGTCACVGRGWGCELDEHCCSGACIGWECADRW